MLISEKVPESGYFFDRVKRSMTVSLKHAEGEILEYFRLDA